MHCLLRCMNWYCWGVSISGILIDTKIIGKNEMYSIPSLFEFDGVCCWGIEIFFKVLVGCQFFLMGFKILVNLWKDLPPWSVPYFMTAPLEINNMTF